MQYELRIQDPTDPPRSPLLDELVALATDGEVAWLRMFFGFLTGSGVDALMGVPVVQAVLLNSKVEVLVGLDAVTDRPGLQRLLELARRNPQFEPSVIKNASGALIHPKMLVAGYADGRVVVVVGSNNLSRNGLGGNVEGYTIARFEPEEDVDFSDWDAFILRWRPLIGEIDDDALEVAEQNERRLRRMRTAVRETRAKSNSGVVVSDGQVYEPPISQIEDLEELVLVAQIPKGGNRWSQVGYSKPIIRDYFDVEAGDHVFLREFDSAKIEEPQVVNPSANRNHRIELGAAREAEKAEGYPAEGCPVVLMQREKGALRLHRYVFLMPGDEGHDEIARLAEAHFTGPANQVPRVIVPRSRVMTAWPGCPL